MTRSKSEIKDKVKKNVPLIYEEYPYATGSVALVFLLIGVALGAWWT